jgi:hypothetical protein
MPGEWTPEQVKVITDYATNLVNKLKDDNKKRTVPEIHIGKMILDFSDGTWQPAENR